MICVSLRGKYILIQLIDKYPKSTAFKHLSDSQISDFDGKLVYSTFKTIFQPPYEDRERLLPAKKIHFDYFDQKHFDALTEEQIRECFKGTYGMPGELYDMIFNSPTYKRPLFNWKS